MQISTEEEADDVPSPGEASLDVLDQVQKDIVDLMQQQVAKIKIHTSSGKPLTASQSVMLTRFMSTLTSLRPPASRLPRLKGVKSDEVESEFSEQLSGMSKKEVLKMLLPYLEDIGIDIASIKFNKQAIGENENEGAASSISRSSQDREL